MQQPDGNIPWVEGGHTDPWNLVEAAMALDVGGRFDDAERAYDVAARACSTVDGSWHAYYQGDDVKEHTLDTNVTCYVANGVWHHYLRTRDTGFLEELFPVVERAIDFALDNQHSTGEIEWDADPDRVEGKGALLTGSSSIYSSLRCAIAAAERLGRERPDWELSLGSLAIAIAHRPERFLDKERWAMDWYYPILGGVLRGHAAEARIASKWDTFVAPGRGVRCVSDQPWVTAAETCELVMALDAIGLHDRAHQLFRWVQFLRHDDGSYWTGMNFAGDRFDGVGRVLHGRAADVEQRDDRARGERARRRRSDVGSVPRRRSPRRSHRRGADRSGCGHRGRPRRLPSPRSLTPPPSQTARNSYIRCAVAARYARSIGTTWPPGEIVSTRS